MGFLLFTLVVTNTYREVVDLGITQYEPDPGVEENCFKQELLMGFIRQSIQFF